MSRFSLSATCAAIGLLAAACGGGGDEPAVIQREAPATVGALALSDETRSDAQSDAAQPDEALSGEVLVKLVDGGQLQSLLAQYSLMLLDQFGARPIYRLRANPGSDVEALVEQLASDPRVRYAEPNLMYSAPEGGRFPIWAIGGDAVTYAAQWSGGALRLPEAHMLSRGEGATVAVLDSGADAAHPALAGRLVPGFDFVDFDADPAEFGTDGDSGYGHGTFVASLVAQVAPAARIMPIRVLDRHGAGNVWVLAEALLHAVDPDGNPATDDGAKVINLSLGTIRKTALLEDVIDVASCEADDENDDDADDRERCSAFGGAVVAIAAGNSGDSTPHYPAAEEDQPGALAVAASAADGRLASFSTRGDWVHLAAPGELVHGAVPGGRWAVWSGTSMAAPMVAGAAALMVARYPGWKASDIASMLKSSGRVLCGTGLKQVDAAAALGGTSGSPASCP